MDNRELEKHLRDALKRLGVRVRVEPVEDSSGGFCRLDDEPVVVVSPDLSRSRRNEIFISALKQLDTSGIYLPPAIRDRLEEDSDASHK